MTGKTWVLVGSDAGVSNLLDMARSLGADVVAAVAGSEDLADTIASTGVSKVYWFDGGDAPVEAYALQVAATLAETEGQPGLVVAGSSPQDRVLLGAVAARLQCPLLSGAHTLSADGEALLVQRSVFGGIGEQTDRIVGPLALMLDGGRARRGQRPSGAGRAGRGRARGADRHRDPRRPSTKRSTSGRPPGSSPWDAASRPRRTSVWSRASPRPWAPRWPCSRPLAEGLDWYPKDRYVGVSGLKLSPNLYVAVGVSGQLQHMVGARESEVIVAINSDKNAPVFAECDYGIVGDLYAVVPATDQGAVVTDTGHPVPRPATTRRSRSRSTSTSSSSARAWPGRSRHTCSRSRATRPCSSSAARPPAARTCPGGPLHPLAAAGVPRLRSTKHPSSGGSPATTSTSSTPTLRSASTTATNAWPTRSTR